ncbi:MAG: PKD domain-containing protein [bacterium]|nr:PKD domain-containing protein [bacterium]
MKKRFLWSSVLIISFLLGFPVIALSASTQTVHVFVTVDGLPPTVTITSPIDGHETTVSSIIISGAASDTGTGVMSVEIDTGDTNTGDTANFSFMVELIPDTKTFIVTATDSVGNTGSDTVTVYYCPIPEADFTVDNPTPCSGATVCFTDVSTGTVTGWSWDLDGDSNVDATDSSPCWAYHSPGDYTVSLTVSDTCGSDSETRTAYITVNGSTVAADFGSDTTTGCAPLTVNFSDSSTGDVLSWLWDFGDGTTSSDSNPSHIYPDSGTYTVSLTVSDTCGSDSETRTDYITVTDTITTVLSVSPATKTVGIEDTFTLDINLANAPEFDSLGAYLSFDTNTLEVTNLTQGPFPLGAAPIKSEYDNQTGQINYAAGVFSGTTRGSGTVLTITFKAKSQGSPSITFDTVSPRNTQILNGITPVAFTTQLTTKAAGDIITLKDLIPARTSLSQNYPNPLNPETWIPFSLTTMADVVINIYSLSGQLIRSLNLGEKKAGYYRAKSGAKSAVYWDGKNEAGEEVASGIYLYQLRAGSFVSTRKMIVLK